LDFKLFTIDQQKNEEVDLCFDPRPEAERLYFLELTRVARAIANILEQMRGGPLLPETATATVYLAETTSDRESEREDFAANSTGADSSSSHASHCRTTADTAPQPSTPSFRARVSPFICW
jgi:methylthioribose-1-phosphate isomerase